jgi:hypothetical protein
VAEGRSGGPAETRQRAGGAGAGGPGDEPGDLLAELDAAAKAAAESGPDDPPDSDPTASGAGWLGLLSDVDTDDDQARPAPARRRLALLAKIAGGTAVVVAAALLTRHIGSGPTPATGPAAAPTASATAAPAATVRLTSVKVGDQGRKVTLSWQGPPGMSYAVIVAVAGASAPAAKLVNQARSRVFAIQPGQPYCFQVQGTFDGVNAVQSAPKGINGAACQN